MADMKGEWWYPEVVDDAYLARLRQDYPTNAHLSDDALREAYECETKYVSLWDSIGEAYDQYEQVADWMLKLEEEVKRLRDVIQDVICDPFLECHPTTMSKLQAARGKAVERLLSPMEADWLLVDLRQMAAIIGCLEPSEDGEPSCDPPCVACRYGKVAEAAEEPKP